MKKIVVLAGMAALLAMPAFAAINPLDPGLPQDWTATAAMGYGGSAAERLIAGAAPRLSTTQSYASVMCVECHGANPSDKVAAPIDASGFAVTNGALHQGSHAVINNVATTAAFGRTNSGGGFAGGFTAARTGGEYEKLDAWATTLSRSKYGTGAAYLTQAYTTTAGDYDMICESCHNLLTNAGNQLTVAAFSHAATDTMCVGCHSVGGGAETYAGFQANGNLPNFNAASRKRHHVLAGETLDTSNGGPYDPDSNDQTNDSIMWAPAYSKELGTGKFATWAYATTIADGADFAFRNQVNVSGAGTYDTPLAAGDIGTGTTLACVSCHRPHNAMTKAGAFILRTGTNGDFTSANATGIARQSEIGNWRTGKIYGEYTVLCAGCHQGYN